MSVLVQLCTTINRTLEAPLEHVARTRAVTE